MSNTPLAKREYREVVRNFRSSLSQCKIDSISELIQDKALSLIRKLDPALVHCYLSFEPNREINTDRIINNLLLFGRQLAVPRILPDKDEFESVLVDRNTKFNLNNWGIREPAEGEVVADIDIELVLVPLLCADFSGIRIGYGKGYYDRFLHATAAVTVGLCPEDCLFINVPYEDHDKPLDYVITENRILRITI